MTNESGDEQHVARAREISTELRVRSGDFDREAGWLMAWMADRLGGRPAVSYLDEAAAEVRKELAANGALAEDNQHLPADSEMRQRIRKERLLIIDRLIAIGAAEGGRCPPCDGDLPGEEANP